MNLQSVYVSFVLSASMLAQEPAKPNTSMADGLVRQLIEREQLQPPRLESGLEMGQGKGPMVLMIWRADGSMSLHELQRGYGDFGPAAEKRIIEEPEVVEEEEEVVEVVEVVEEAEGQKKAGRDAAGRKVQRGPPVEAKVRLRRNGDELRVEIGPRLLRGAEVDRKSLQSALQVFVADRELVIEPESDVLMQDVLTTCEVARGAGLDRFSFGGGRAVRDQPLKPEMLEQLVSLPATFDWPVERVAGAAQQPICEGELLVLLDGECRWSRFRSLLQECAKIGIWQIALVGQKDARTRLKLPTHLPFDRGLVK